MAAMQLRVIEGNYTERVRGSGGETFCELSPNCIQLILHAVCPELENGVFVDIGCGTGLPALAAVLHRFKAVYGWEKNPELIDQWKSWQDTLCRRDSSWNEILSKCHLWQGDCSEVTEEMKEATQGANVVLCWNSRFDQRDNEALFRFVAENMLTEDAVFVCTTLPPTLVELHRVYLDDMTPKQDVFYCCNPNVRGKLVGLGHDWFHVYKLGQDAQRYPIRSAVSTKRKRGLPDLLY
jgi:SAM-dependent methyltransferase